VTCDFSRPRANDDPLPARPPSPLSDRLPEIYTFDIYQRPSSCSLELAQAENSLPADLESSRIAPRARETFPPIVLELTREMRSRAAARRDIINLLSRIANNTTRLRTLD